jgi:hypothetical protein
MRALPHLGLLLAVISVGLLHATRRWLGSVAFSCLLYPVTGASSM